MRSHNDELAAQRIMIQQLTEAVQRLNAEKETNIDKLNDLVTLVDRRFAESQSGLQEIRDTSHKRHGTITETMTNFANEIVQKLDAVNQDLELLKRNSQAHPSTTNAPSAPPSWTSAPSTPPRPPTAETSSTPRPAEPTQQPDESAPHFGQSHARASNQYPTAGQPASYGPSQGFSSVPPSSAPREAPPEPSTTGSAKNFGPNVSHFHMGSPGSPLNGAGVQWAPGAGTELRPFDPRDWSVEGKKPSRELKTYDGDMAHYDNWRRRVRDHFVGANVNYSKIFEMIEKEKVPIHWNMLATTRIQSLPMVNWEWIATHLWTFTGAYLEDGLLSRRIMMCSGEEFNGLELWRVLYQQNSGGSVPLENLEREYFVSFPKCEKVSNLQPHLAQWVQLKNKYGVGLPNDHLIAMFWKILPEEVKEDVKKQKDIRGNLDLQIAYLYGEIGDSMDEKLSKWNLAKLQQQLHSKSKNTTGLNAMNAHARDEPQVEVPPTAAPPPPFPDMAAFEANVERMVNAAVARGRGSDKQPSSTRTGSSGSQRGNRRIPNPQFKGCWCCGEEGHTRGKCPKFAAIKKANGGKVPSNYEGAYERSMKKTSKVVAPVMMAEELSEHEETLPMWPLLKSSVPPIHTKNNFQIFESDTDDDEDDEDSVVRSLHALTPNVHLAKDRARSQREKRNRSKPMDINYLKLIARQVKNGEMNLPDIDLETDEDFEYVWALVDSGAGANVARRKHFSNFKDIDAPAISLTIANGEVMANTGAGEVTTHSRNGKATKRVFYEAPVDMPILSVAELSKEGELGSEIRFRTKDGIMVDNLTKDRTHFVKRKGVYFVRLYMRKNSVDFPRQDP